jgi:hypothetical protein
MWWGVLRAEAREDDAPLVGLAVPVGVLQVDELRAVGHVAAAVARLDAGRDEEPLGEDGRLVGLAVAVRVLQDHDLVVRDLAGNDLGIVDEGRDPEPPARVPVHLRGLGDERIGGEQRDLEPVGDLEALPLDLGSGGGGSGFCCGER